MPDRFPWFRLFAVLLLVCLFTLIANPPVWAATDSYISRYLKVTDAVALPLDVSGKTRPFSATELTAGKHLFEQNCLNCHVGGATLPDPTVSLSLKDLAGATPQRDTIEGLVSFLRHPMTYDGSEETVWCREVPDTWLSQAQVESLAGFVLRAAQVAPGWGLETFQGE
jgi:photosystem II cytochrome c550